ncbi:MAG: hypothetical protein LEGION0398_MBIBDBAK_00680 [Legionellaceae bacterium]
MLFEAYKALKRSEYLLKNHCIFCITTHFEERLNHCEMIAEHGEYDDKKAFIDLIYEKKEKTAMFPALKTLTENLTKIENYFRKLCSPTFDYYPMEQEQIDSLYSAPAA